MQTHLTTNRGRIVVLDAEKMQPDIAQRASGQQNARIRRKCDRINGLLVATQQSGGVESSIPSRSYTSCSLPFTCARAARHSTHRMIVLFWPHKQTVPLSSELTMYAPSGLKAHARTASPFSWYSTHDLLPSAMSHRMIVPSTDADAMTLPCGEESRRKQKV